jgi:hypothetical protein
VRTLAPLRVLVVGLNYAPEHTGIAPYTTGMARGLAQAGHQVHVVAGYPRTTPSGGLPTAIAGCAVKSGTDRSQ